MSVYCSIVTVCANGVVSWFGNGSSEEILNVKTSIKKGTKEIQLRTLLEICADPIHI
jgi:hypothetical protein